MNQTEFIYKWCERCRHHCGVDEMEECFKNTPDGTEPDNFEHETEEDRYFLKNNLKG